MAPSLYAASVTPLREGGSMLDDEAIGPLVEFLLAGGVDGVFACGTTGEGVLLTLDERRRAAVRFREACTGTLIVHCGAQTTADTATLAAHAAEIEADGAAVIPPPYYPLDDDALVEHFCAAAAACDPLPFYLYAFAARSGYPLPPAVVVRVAQRAGNLAGLKVSEASFEAVATYLALSLPVFVGSEPLIPQALAAGAAGSVSGIASAFPDIVSGVVRDPSPDGAARMRELRDALGTTTFIPALKTVLRDRGVPIEPDVRAPLRPLAAPDEQRLSSLRATL
ncbi:MAG: dihydrodipicolinate synthase family protein [Gaiellales bacterium]